MKLLNDDMLESCHTAGATVHVVRSASDILLLQMASDHGKPMGHAQLGAFLLVPPV